MKYIILSTDGPRSLYEVPDKIAKNLVKYCLDFCDWVQNGPKSKELKKGCILEEEFIKYLNDVVNPNYLYKSRYIMTFDTIDDEYIIPAKYSDCPSFNF